VAVGQATTLLPIAYEMKITNWLIRLMSKTNRHSKHYQVPKSNHPWRQYKNRIDDTEDEDVIPAEKLPSLFNFLKDMVENWETYQIPSSDVGDAYVKINSANPAKSAEWIASFIRKTWVKRERGFYIDGLT